MFKLQLLSNCLLFLINLLGIAFNRRNFLITLMCIELILLNINISFLILSIYLDDFYGQLFSLFVLVIAASESAIGLAIIISYYKLRSSIQISQKIILRY